MSTELCREVGDLATLICRLAEEAIDGAVNNGNTIPITTLSHNIAHSFLANGGLQVDKTFVYHIVSAYFKRRDDLYMKMGPGGGIAKKPVAQHAT